MTLAVGTGCDTGSGEFDDAPTAHAPPPSQAKARGGAMKKRRGQRGRSGELPSGHPPVTGSAGGTRSAGAGRRGSGSGALSRAPSRNPSGGGGSDEGGAPPSQTGPLRWKVPDAWTRTEPATRMRLTQYRVPGAQGSGPATLAVFHFGASEGGSIQANIDRWIGQFDPEGDVEPKQAAEIDERTVDGVKVHVVDISGRYNPGMAGGAPKDDQRMLAAIAETSEGPFFFKLVGPKPTVGANRDAFRTVVDSFRTP
ncbi:MAG: hypothetical protein ABEL76_00405 [Bradymonadaceae bacterium]